MQVFPCALVTVAPSHLLTDGFASVAVDDHVLAASAMSVFKVQCQLLICGSNGHPVFTAICAGPAVCLQLASVPVDIPVTTYLIVQVFPHSADCVVGCVQ